MPPPRAVADTNVLVAAAITPRGLCGRLLEAAIDGRWQLVASPMLLTELETVLERDKFRRWLSEHEAARFVTDIRALCGVVPDPPSATSAQTSDPKDEYLLALAKVARVVALISGDPDLTELADLEPPVLRPATFLDGLRD